MDGSVTTGDDLYSGVVRLWRADTNQVLVRLNDDEIDQEQLAYYRYFSVDELRATHMSSELVKRIENEKVYLVQKASYMLNFDFGLRLTNQKSSWRRDAISKLRDEAVKWQARNNADVPTNLPPQIRKLFADMDQGNKDLLLSETLRNPVARAWYTIYQKEHSSPSNHRNRTRKTARMDTDSEEEEVKGDVFPDFENFLEEKHNDKQSGDSGRRTPEASVDNTDPDMPRGAPRGLNFSATEALVEENFWNEDEFLRMLSRNNTGLTESRMRMIFTFLAEEEQVSRDDLFEFLNFNHDSEFVDDIHLMKVALGMNQTLRLSAPVSKLSSRPKSFTGASSQTEYYDIKLGDDASLKTIESLRLGDNGWDVSTPGFQSSLRIDDLPSDRADIDLSLELEKTPKSGGAEFNSQRAITPTNLMLSPRSQSEPSQKKFLAVSQHKNIRDLFNTPSAANLAVNDDVLSLENIFEEDEDYEDYLEQKKKEKEHFGRLVYDFVENLRDGIQDITSLICPDIVDRSHLRGSKEEVFEPLVNWSCERVVTWWTEETEFSQVATVWSYYGLTGKDFINMTTTHMFQLFSKIPSTYKLTPDEQRKCLKHMAILASHNRMEENYIRRLETLKRQMLIGETDDIRERCKNVIDLLSILRLPLEDGLFSFSAQSSFINGVDNAMSFLISLMSGFSVEEVKGYVIGSQDVQYDDDDLFEILERMFEDLGYLIEQNAATEWLETWYARSIQEADELLRLIETKLKFIEKCQVTFSKPTREIERMLNIPSIANEEDFEERQLALQNQLEPWAEANSVRVEIYKSSLKRAQVVNDRPQMNFLLLVDTGKKGYKQIRLEDDFSKRDFEGSVYIFTNRFHELREGLVRIDNPEIRISKLSKLNMRFRRLSTVTFIALFIGIITSIIWWRNTSMGEAERQIDDTLFSTVHGSEFIATELHEDLSFTTMQLKTAIEVEDLKWECCETNDWDPWFGLFENSMKDDTGVFLFSTDPMSFILFRKNDQAYTLTTSCDFDNVSTLYDYSMSSGSRDDAPKEALSVKETIFWEYFMSRPEGQTLLLSDVTAYEGRNIMSFIRYSDDKTMFGSFFALDSDFTANLAQMRTEIGVATYLALPNGDVFASSEGDVDVSTSGIPTSASDPRISSSISHFRSSGFQSGQISSEHRVKTSSKSLSSGDIYVVSVAEKDAYAGWINSAFIGTLVTGIFIILISFADLAYSIKRERYPNNQPHSARPRVITRQTAGNVIQDVDMQSSKVTKCCMSFGNKIRSIFTYDSTSMSRIYQIHSISVVVLLITLGSIWAHYSEESSKSITQVTQTQLHNGAGSIILWLMSKLELLVHAGIHRQDSNVWDRYFYNTLNELVSFDDQYLADSMGWAIPGRRHSGDVMYSGRVSDGNVYVGGMNNYTNPGGQKCLYLWEAVDGKRNDADYYTRDVGNRTCRAMPACFSQTCGFNFRNEDWYVNAINVTEAVYFISFCGSDDICLTASKAVRDESDEVTGVFVIGIRLQKVSAILKQFTDGTTHIFDDPRIYAFDPHTYSPDEVLSLVDVNNSIMLTSKEDLGSKVRQACRDGVEEEVLGPYNVLDHPDPTTQNSANQIIHVNLVDNLPISSKAVNGGSQKVEQPTNLATARVKRYQFMGSVDWVFVTVFDIGGEILEMRRNETLGFIIIIIIAASALYVHHDIYRNMKVPKFEEIKQHTDGKAKLHDIKIPVKMASKKRFSYMYSEDDQPITVDKAKTFLNRRAVKHLQEADSSSLIKRCTYESKSMWWELGLMKLTKNPAYVCVLYTVIIIHIILMFWEPVNMDDYNSSHIFVYALSYLCVSIEWMDRILVHYGQYSFDAFSGRWMSYTALLSYVSLNLVFASAGVFNIEHYFPLRPLLIILRYHVVYWTFLSFIRAIVMLGKPMFMYLCAVTVFSIFGLLVYRTEINVEDVSSSYNDISEAFITTFVFMSTGENYESIVYPALGIGKPHIFYFIMLFFIGAVCLVPLFIHKFEVAYRTEARARRAKFRDKRKNAIVAAFILLDVNHDASLDLQELSRLLEISPEMKERQVWKLNALKKAGGDIGVNEFCELMLPNSTFVCHPPPNQGRWRALLELYIFRNKYRRMVLILFLVFPMLAIGMMYGLTKEECDRSWCTLDWLLLLWFLMNILEIVVHISAVGLWRFVSWHASKDPPFMKFCETKWRLIPTLNAAGVSRDPLPNPSSTLTMARAQSLQRRKTPGRSIPLEQDQKMQLLKLKNLGAKAVKVNLDNFVPLTADDWLWAEENLRPLKPPTPWKRNVMTLISRFEFFLVLFSGMSLFITVCLQSDVQYSRVFMAFPILRVFTLVSTNRDLVLTIMRVAQELLYMLLIMFCFIVAYGRLGVTLFEGDTEAVLSEDIHPSQNFDSLWNASVVLLQLWVGEGWHSLMYTIISTTNLSSSSYFVVYIVLLTLVVSNVFIAILLSTMSRIDIEQFTEHEAHRRAVERIDSLILAHIRRKKRQLQLLTNEIENLEKALNEFEHITTHDASFETISAYDDRFHIEMMVRQIAREDQILKQVEDLEHYNSFL